MRDAFGIIVLGIVALVAWEALGKKTPSLAKVNALAADGNQQLSSDLALLWTGSAGDNSIAGDQISATPTDLFDVSQLAYTPDPYTNTQLDLTLPQAG